MKNFNITMGKGFQMKFDNGYAVSIQFGYGNYCDNSNESKAINTPNCQSNDAECAVFDPNGDLVDIMGWGDTVRGWMSPSEVVELINAVSAMEESE